jgi:hypothetical protein
MENKLTEEENSMPDPLARREVIPLALPQQPDGLPAQRAHAKVQMINNLTAVVIAETDKTYQQLEAYVVGKAG